ncbi:hypothetical protein HSX11_28400 [Oxalobacteraceae bacterium]|nr:hypothetical protein [Oxalobacteraceae bacterium]
MKKFFLAGLLMLLASLSGATKMGIAGLDALVKMSDLIVVAKVSKVDMIDGAGKQVNDVSAMTGQGSGNTIRMYLQVSKVLFNSGPKPPATIVVNETRAKILQLGPMRDLSKERMEIFFLKKGSHEPADPGSFRRDLSEKPAVLKLITEISKSAR